MPIEGRRAAIARFGRFCERESLLVAAFDRIGLLDGVTFPLL